MSETASRVGQWRHYLVLTVFATGALVLGWRMIDLQVINNEAYQDKGESAHLKVVAIPAHRGMIVDRNAEPLAVSTPVNAIWGKPKELLAHRETLPTLAKLLEIDAAKLLQEVEKKAGRDFMYLKRRSTPDVVERLKELKIPGVYFQREYKRFYPTGEVASHLLGLTDVDDVGQLGLERAYDHWLRGEFGSKRVLQDRKGNSLAEVELIEDARSGGTLTLSIDKHIQYLAYRELKAAFEAHDAVAASMVVLDARTGEVLAMVNQPAFNPNARSQIVGDAFGNRTVTELYEPGSTVKPFVVAAALETGGYMANTLIDTSPGQMFVGRHRVIDVHNYGLIDVSTAIKKSSNIAVAKMALGMDKEYLWNMYAGVGFGVPTDTYFPREQTGYVNDYNRWSRIDQATASFGYGMTTTVLQLARAYSVLANGGELKPVSLQKLEQAPAGVRVFKKDTVDQVVKMMESAVSKEGTAPLAKIPGYRVAGKTGTVKKIDKAGGYAKDKYVSLFAGMVPASDPRLIGVVLVDEPRGKDYYGGLVAAPVFSKVMAGALRLLNIPPDEIKQNDGKLNVIARRDARAQAGTL